MITKSVYLYLYYMYPGNLLNTSTLCVTRYIYYLNLKYSVPGHHIGEKISDYLYLYPLIVTFT